jgi:polyisoprenoid-binding protein YceI
MRDSRPAPRFAHAFLATIAFSILLGPRPAIPAQARIGILELDPSKTLVQFKLAGSLHTMHGDFKLARGTIKADSATGKAEGLIVVDAASGESGDWIRDARMKDSILETKSYPEITFAPQQVSGDLDRAGAFKAKLEGLLTLHGIQHTIRMDANGTLAGDSLVAVAHFSIPYVEWGLKDPSMLFLTVAKTVDVDIAAAGHVIWLSGGESSR